MRCSGCNTSLDSTKLTEKDGEPFCRRCYAKVRLFFFFFWFISVFVIYGFCFVFFFGDGLSGLSKRGIFRRGWEDGDGRTISLHQSLPPYFLGLIMSQVDVNADLGVDFFSNSYSVLREVGTRFWVNPEVESSESQLPNLKLWLCCVSYSNGRSHDDRYV